MNLARIYDPVREDLDALQRLLRDELAADDPFIGELVTHVLKTRGKMLRPALVCLSALACGGGSNARLETGGAVEMIHIASLIHDDVIDAADLRRGEASVNSIWGTRWPCCSAITYSAKPSTCWPGCVMPASPSRWQRRP